jgi:hypothetical protein
MTKCEYAPRGCTLYDPLRIVCNDNRISEQCSTFKRTKEMEGRMK